MSGSEFNWLHLGYVIWFLLWTGFLIAAFKRRWSGFGMVVALANMVIAMLHSVAPFRGALDPDYAGYRFLVIEVERGLGVTAVAGSILIAAYACALIALLDRRGAAMRFLEGWSALLAAALGVPLLIGLVTEPAEFSINLGEYASIPWFIAFPLLLGLVVLPFALAVPWAHRRAAR